MHVTVQAHKGIGLVAQLGKDQLTIEAGGKVTQYLPGDHVGILRAKLGEQVWKERLAEDQRGGQVIVLDGDEGPPPGSKKWMAQALADEFKPSMDDLREAVVRQGKMSQNAVAREKPKRAVLEQALGLKESPEEPTGASGSSSSSTSSPAGTSTVTAQNSKKGGKK